MAFSSKFERITPGQRRLSFASECVSVRFVHVFVYYIEHETDTNILALFTVIYTASSWYNVLRAFYQAKKQQQQQQQLEKRKNG